MKTTNIKFLKNGIRYNGKYIPVFYIYSTAEEKKDNRETIVIYSRSILKPLPAILGVRNNSDSQIDYFETDKSTFYRGDEYFDELLELIKKI